jgi:hypothetical protein
MSNWQKRFNKRVREICKCESGKSQVKRGDAQTVLVNFAKAFAKNPIRESRFLFQLALKHEGVRK